MLSVEQQQTVQFTSEGVKTVSDSMPLISDISTSLKEMTVRQDRRHEISDFLSRPVIIKQDTWKTTDTQGKQLFTADFPDAFLANDMYKDKLRGYVGVRATLVVKVQVNSQPFQAGRLLLQYYPYAQYMPNRAKLCNATLQGRTGCPHTDLDLSVGTEISMRMPYVSPHLYYNLITGQGSFGTIYLVVYSPLTSKAESACEYTVWAHLEDVDVQFPTGAHLYSSATPSSKFERIFVQMGSELQQLATLNSTASPVGRVSESTFNKSIPQLGNIFTRPGWISNQFSDFIKTLGFSKPTSQGDVNECKLRSGMRMNNFDGVDTSYKLGLSSTNEIETQEGLAGSSVDEMAISHIVSIPTFWQSSNWSTAQNPGDQIMSDFVTPFKVAPISATITDRFKATHMGYMANTFALWRGSLNYTLKFVKTKFHSGRVRISFLPFFFNNDISIANPDINRCQQLVVDIRESTEVSFAIPYVSTRPWMYCVRPQASWLGDKSVKLYNACTGLLRIDVLNKLVCPDTVSDKVVVLMEVSGGQDLEFSIPTAPSYIPWAGDITTVDVTGTTTPSRSTRDERFIESTSGGYRKMPTSEFLPLNNSPNLLTSANYNDYAFSALSYNKYPYNAVIPGNALALFEQNALVWKDGMYKASKNLTNVDVNGTTQTLYNSYPIFVLVSDTQPYKLYNLEDANALLAREKAEAAVTDTGTRVRRDLSFQNLEAMTKEQLEKLYDEPTTSFDLQNMISQVIRSGTYFNPLATSLSERNDSTYSLRGTGQRETIRPQMGDVGVNESPARNDAQLGASPATIDGQRIKSNWSPSALCIGEKVLSVRQLIKRVGDWFSITNSSTESGGTATLDSFHVVFPFSFRAPPTEKQTDTNKSAASVVSMLDYFYFIFAFWRGSMRLKFHLNSGDSGARLGKEIVHVSMLASVQDRTNDLLSKLKDAYSLETQNLPAFSVDSKYYPKGIGGAAMIDIDTSLEGLGEIEVPYYSVSYISPAITRDADSAPYALDDVYRGSTPSPIVLITTNHNKKSVEVTCRRGTGDDFSLLYLVGCPPLINVTSLYKS